MGISERFSINLIGFQVVWWVCILFGNSGLLLPVCLLLLHIWFHSSSQQELKVVLLTAVCGFVIDAVLTLMGVFVFTDQLYPPIWLFVLWCGFCATLRVSLKFFQRRYWLAAVIGSLGGSSTYIAAHKLDAMALGYPLGTTFLLLSLIWFFLFPFLILMSEKLSESPRFISS